MFTNLHISALVLGCFLYAGIPGTNGFTQGHFRVQPLVGSVSSQKSLQPLYVFGRKKKDEKEEGDNSDSDSDSETGGNNRSLPFFGRMLRRKEASDSEPPPTVTAKVSDPQSQSTPVATVSTPPKKPRVPVTPEPEDPVEKADLLRSQARRARLEAEKMDAELTLSKIERLEKELVVAKNKEQSVEDLQLQLDNLQAKLRGEPPKSAPKPVQKEKETTTSVTSEIIAESDMSSSNANDNVEKKKEQGTTTIAASETDDSTSKLANAGVMLALEMADLVEGQRLDETVDLVEAVPGFLKKVMATVVELDYETPADINATEVASRLCMVSNRDFSFSALPKPTFTDKQIEEAMTKIENGNVGFPERWEKDLGDDKRTLAVAVLEMDYYIESRISGTQEEAKEFMDKFAEGEDWLKPLLQSKVDRSVDQMFPKCTRKEDADEPTMAQMESLVAKVLPAVKYSTSAKPEKILGGYILRGSHKYENGDELIAAIDKELEKTSLADKMKVLYTTDFTVFARAEEEDFEIDIFDTESVPPILYITGPDIVRERKPVALSITTAFGFATSWYLSIYPFLLNPALSQRVDEQLGVAEAGMNYDLQWLTDMTVPLFWAFLGIQAMHEVGHRVVAGAYDMKVSVPTLVPSFLTGITSTVTTFKEPPKNKEALFDFAVAGPMTGVLASVAALVVGSQLTLTSDPASLPGLPLEILRQSTLGGGIIDAIMKGSLYIPDGAPMSGITISLHPLAVAGYIGLIVNALALLPVGTTDGGRIALALFGRGGKLAVGNIGLFALLFTGVLGSDLFLFYFAFVVAFQSGNEVPARNEVDDISFPRVILATIAFATAFLALVPFQ